VAKEYVAAQNPSDPGVLVLSKFAGAANELDAALLVNPHDIDGMARTIATALSMPLTERRMRYEAMMQKLRGHSIQQWFADFIEALRQSPAKRIASGPIPPDTPTLLPLRSAGSAARFHCSKTIGHAVQRRAVRLRARILHLHHPLAAAVADHHALTDDDGRAVTDDNAWVLRGEVGPRAVRPDDGVAGKDAAPAILAGHVIALPGAFLRRRGARTARRDHRNEDGGRDLVPDLGPDPGSDLGPDVHGIPC